MGKSMKQAFTIVSGSLQHGSATYYSDFFNLETKIKKIIEDRGEAPVMIEWHQSTGGAGAEHTFGVFTSMTCILHWSK